MILGFELIIKMVNIIPVINQGAKLANRLWQYIDHKMRPERRLLTDNRKLIDITNGLSIYN